MSDRTELRACVVVISVVRGEGDRGRKKGKKGEGFLYECQILFHNANHLMLLGSSHHTKRLRYFIFLTKNH